MSRIYRVNVMMTYAAQRCINSWHLRCPDSGITDTLLQAWVTGMITPQLQDTASAVSFDQLDYRRVDISATAGAVFVPTGWPVAGSDAGADLPTFCAMLIKGVASGQARPNRIRKFLPGILETDSSGSVYAASGTTKIGNIRTAWQNWINAGVDLLPVAASYDTTPGVAGGMVDNVGSRWNLITDVSASTVISVMRTRKIGVGV